MSLIERWRMSRPEWQQFHQEALIGARDQADRSLARANAAMAERDQAREQLRGAVGALAKIHDLAKYLNEPAWNEEGCRLVAEQIMRLAAPHLGGQ